MVLPGVQALQTLPVPGHEHLLTQRALPPPQLLTVQPSKRQVLIPLLLLLLNLPTPMLQRCCVLHQSKMAVTGMIDMPKRHCCGAPNGKREMCNQMHHHLSQAP